jgi:S1-C subfamily serine protease
MSTRKTTAFYAVLLVVASLFVGMVIASRFDLTPASSAQTITVPPINSAPLTGPLDASTFRNIAKAATPMVVNIRTEMKAKAQDLTDFFGSGGQPDDLFHRFFGNPGQQDDRARGRRQRPAPPAETVAAGTGSSSTRTA